MFLAGQDMKEEVLTELNADVTGLKGNTPCLKREKASRPCLSAQKHPHGLVPPNQSHPHTGQGRPKVYGNDNSSVNRQSRSQSAKPDPIPGTSCNSLNYLIYDTSQFKHISTIFIMKYPSYEQLKSYTIVCPHSIPPRQYGSRPWSNMPQNIMPPRQ